jgi:hypothetical protein
MSPLGVSPSAYTMEIGGGVVTLPRPHAVLGVVEKPAVNTWKLKRAVGIIVNDPNLTELAREDEWAAIKIALAEQSPEAALGTAVHFATAMVDRGRIAPTLPHLLRLRQESDPDREWPRMIEAEEVLPYVEQWERCKRIHGLEVLDVERPVAHTAMGWAGTLDRILRAASLERPLPMIGDLKTGRAVYPEAVLQMGAYAHAEVMTTDGWDHASPMPEVDQELALAIHLKPTGARVIPVNIGEGWRAFRAVRALFEWETINGRASIGSAIPDPPEPEDEWPW